MEDKQEYKLFYQIAGGQNILQYMGAYTIVLTPEITIP